MEEKPKVFTETGEGVVASKVAEEPAGIDPVNTSTAVSTDLTGYSADKKLSKDPDEPMGAEQIKAEIETVEEPTPEPVPEEPKPDVEELKTDVEKIKEEKEAEKKEVEENVKPVDEPAGL